MSEHTKDGAWFEAEWKAGLDATADLRERLRASLELLRAAKCPNCEGIGWFVVPNRYTGDAEQQQCQWCAERASAVDGDHE